MDTFFSYLFVLSFLAVLLPQSTLGYFVNIDAHAEECFFDKMASDTKMGLTLEVAKGGFLDIDVKIYRPDGKVIHAGDRESNGKYTFSAPVDGSYKYCFTNKVSKMTPKVVMLSMDWRETQRHKTTVNFPA